MMTPQDVANCTFAKSMMGGYNMASVDDFLDKLTEDYTALFKENAALKASQPGLGRPGRVGDHGVPLLLRLADQGGGHLLGREQGGTDGVLGLPGGQRGGGGGGPAQSAGHAERLCPRQGAGGAAGRTAGTAGSTGGGGAALSGGSSGSSSSMASCSLQTLVTSRMKLRSCSWPVDRRLRSASSSRRLSG